MRIQLLLVALLLASSFALTIKKNSKAQGIEALKKDKSWSKIVLTLAELHMMSEHPIEDLLEAVEQLVADLQEKQDREEALWTDKTSEYRAEVGRLQGEIDSAVTDVANAGDDLENNLYPRRQNLEDDIAAGEEHIRENNERLNKLHSEREESHAAFLERQEEHDAALSALEEALNLLHQLTNESFVQVKFAKNSLQKISQKLGKHLHETLAQALVSLATSEFADSKLVRDVIEKLQHIRDNIRNSQVQEVREEDQAQSDFESEVARLEQNNVETELAVNNDKQSLDATNYSIEEQEKFKAQRESDLAGFQADLQNVNETYEHERQQHEDIAAQLVSELNASSQALQILQSGEFTDYIRQRLAGN